MEQASKQQSRKARHHKMLIEATIDVIATYGVSGASVSRIIDKAKLSRGMIHLHFENKEHLFAEAAEQMRAEYYEILHGFLEKAGERPEARIEALIEANLGERILDPRTTRIWFAFRGEVSSWPAFAAYADTRDEVLQNLFQTAYLELADGCNDPETLASDTTYGTIALLEGFWADYLLHSDSFERETAKRIIYRFIAAQFPTHFTPEGAVSG